MLNDVEFNEIEYEKNNEKYKIIIGNNGIIYNPYYDPNKPLKSFSKKEKEEMLDEYLLFASVSSVELSWELISEFLTFHNFKDDHQFYKEIILTTPSNTL